MNTPWGQSQQSSQVVKGITFYSTAGHGGFKVSKTLNQQIPEYMRNEDGWYEEDCEWAKIAAVFPEMMKTEEGKKDAKKTFKNWFWKEYEQFYGVELAPGESREKDDYTFLVNNIGRFVVTSALVSSVDENFVEVIACKVPEESVLKDNSLLWRNYTTECKKFLVPKDEYKNRNSSGFVIDMEKHQEVSEDA